MLTGTKTNRRSNATNAYDLMTDIAAYVLEEPKRVYMGDWIIHGQDEIQRCFGTTGPACGTVGCIAGNAVMLAGNKGYSGVLYEALSILAGEDSEDDKGLRYALEYELFLNTEVDAEYGTQEYAEIVTERIKEFQSEYEDDLRAVKVTPVKPSTKEKRK